jgi:EAL domain-containing protein (putative c-di-GMP-specific phosphodiesterase class I)
VRGHGSLGRVLSRFRLSWAEGINESAVQVKVESIVRCVHLTGGVVIAEGIEEVSQLRHFFRIGVRLVQGNGLGQPSPVLVPEVVLKSDGFRKAFLELVAEP